MDNQVLTLLKCKFFVKKALGYGFPMCEGECKEDWSAWIHNEKSLWISKKFKTLDPIEQRAILLHECGHISEGIDYKKLITTEIKADLWAIKKGNELGLLKEVELMKEWLRYWSNIKDKKFWNSNRRRYILAARKIISELTTEEVTK